MDNGEMASIALRAAGKMFGELADGRYLEMRRQGMVVTFDLHETQRLGRPVAVIRVSSRDPEDEQDGLEDVDHSC